MVLSKQTILILSSLLYAATAITVPGVTVPDTPEGLVILAQEVVDDGEGILTFYGDADPVAAALSKREESELSKRCGSNSLSCYSGHRANAWTCSQLIYQVEKSSTQLKQSPRSICKTVSGKQCCISWARAVSSGQEKNLASAGYRVLEGCNVWNDGTVSGLTRDTQIGNTCTTQCLSDRADGCE
ncbi:hypothetical protein G7Z17_g1822 [Cylindrodendrum hubeiense]|uniref:WD-like domain-containing protein n=1 Tax=Cylindrodendrum hubeiense TaxID=595255 RepID=A0A9P5HFC6_9HYPO|nr:hypothetical protein G7Z17_g1822 [Cylindrodendrum hubeiense]